MILTLQNQMTPKLENSEIKVLHSASFSIPIMTQPDNMLFFCVNIPYTHAQWVKTKITLSSSISLLLNDHVYNIKDVPLT